MKPSSLAEAPGLSSLSSGSPSSLTAPRPQPPPAVQPMPASGQRRALIETRKARPAHRASQRLAHTAVRPNGTIRRQRPKRFASAHTRASQRPGHGPSGSIADGRHARTIAHGLVPWGRAPGRACRAVRSVELLGDRRQPSGPSSFHSGSPTAVSIRRASLTPVCGQRRKAWSTVCRARPALDPADTFKNVNMDICIRCSDKYSRSQAFRSRSGAFSERPEIPQTRHIHAIPIILYSQTYLQQHVSIHQRIYLHDP
jgi:hypothetical protein